MLSAKDIISEQDLRSYEFTIGDKFRVKKLTTEVLSSKSDIVQIPMQKRNDTSDYQFVVGFRGQRADYSGFDCYRIDDEGEFEATVLGQATGYAFFPIELKPFVEHIEVTTTYHVQPKRKFSCGHARGQESACIVCKTVYNKTVMY